MHSHILTCGYDFCPTQHYRDLADNWPDIISQAIIYDQADLQSAFFMMQMFTKEVEDYFLGRGFTESAEFVKIVREWHEACNSRGLSADQ